MFFGRAWSAFLVGLMGLVLLALSACEGDVGTESTEPPPDPTVTETTNFSFDLNTYHGDGSQTATATSQPLGVVLIDGELLVVARGQGAPPPETYTFTIQVDESAIRVETTITLDLPTGGYDFYFLLKPGNTTARYGGTLPSKLIVGGAPNVLKFVLDPIIGVQVNSVEEFRNLAPFAVVLPDLTSYDEPRIGISVDGSDEQLFSVRPDVGVSILLFLLPGTHEINIRLFDGALVTDVSVEDTVDVPPPDSEEPPPQITVVSLTADADYTLDASGTATFTFNVPVDVVNEVGGPSTDLSPLSSRLKTVAAITGPAIVNPIESSLQLSPVGDDTGAISYYTATLQVANFVPGWITWQLNFVDKQNGQKFSYCGETVNANSSPATFPCDLKLLVRTLATASPTGNLRAVVSDSNGRVAGAVVKRVNPDGSDDTLGITGAGLWSGRTLVGDPLGELLVFLKPGDYTVRVVDEILDPHGTGDTCRRISLDFAGTVNAGQTTVYEIPLGEFECPQPPPPTVVGTFPLDGATDVPVNTEIEVAFSETMNRTAVQEHFLLTFDAGTLVAGTFDWPGTADPPDSVVIFTPGAPLQYGTEHTVTIEKEAGLANSLVFRFTTEPPPPSAEVLELQVSRTVRPVRFHDGFIDLDAPITVRIPGPEDVQVVEDSDGNPLGDPNRYLLTLYLGKVKCMYLAGKLEESAGSGLARFFQAVFNSPVCTGGLRSGAVVTIEPSAASQGSDGDDDDDRGNNNNQGRNDDDDDDDDDNESLKKNRAEIKARVITGNPFFNETRLQVTIEVVNP